MDQSATLEYGTMGIDQARQLFLLAEVSDLPLIGIWTGNMLPSEPRLQHLIMRFVGNGSRRLDTGRNTVLVLNFVKGIPECYECIFQNGGIEFVACGPFVKDKLEKRVIELDDVLT